MAAPMPLVSGNLHRMGIPTLANLDEPRGGASPSSPVVRSGRR